jgi:H+-translocating diphosphatase
VSCAGVKAIDVLGLRMFIGLLIGAMLPYWFSAMTKRNVGSATLRMVEEVRRQFDTRLRHQHQDLHRRVA